MAISHAESNGIEADEAEMTPLLGPLSKLLDLVRTEASLHVSHKLAKIQSETAASQNRHMNHNFARFPSIQERVTKRKSAADQEVSKLERQLKINTDTQPIIAKSLAAAFLEITSRAEKARRVPEVSPDAVSRQEFKELQDMFTKQHDTLVKQQDLITQQRKDIGDLHSSHAEAKKAALRATEQANTTERDLSQDVTKLEDDIERVRKGMQLHSDEMVRTAFTQLKDQLDVQGTRFDHAVRNAVTETTERLDSQGKIISQLSYTVNAATTTASGVQNRLTKLEERLTATKNEVGQIGTNEQRVVTQRLKDYDQKLNNLQSLVEPLRSEIARVHEDLAQNAQRFKDAPKPVTITLPEDQAVASTITEYIMAQVEAKFDASQAALDYLRTELKDDAEAQEDALSRIQDEQKVDLERTKEQLASVAQKVEELENQTRICDSDIKQLEQTIDEKHAQTGAAHESMRGAVKTIQSNMEMLQAKTTSLSDTVAALWRRPVPTAHMPAPAAQDTAQFRPVTRQSPGASNQINGVQSPRNPASPFGSFSGAAPLPRELGVLTEQLRGLTGTVANLKQRMDNLTTEEVVLSMVDQFGRMYPAAKNFQAAAGALQAMDARLETRLDLTDSKVDMLQRSHNDLRSNLDKLAVSSVEECEAKVKEAATVLRKDVEVAMSDARHEFETAMGYQTTTIIDLQHRVEALANTAFDDA